MSKRISITLGILLSLFLSIPVTAQTLTLPKEATTLEVNIPAEPELEPADPQSAGSYSVTTADLGLYLRSGPSTAFEVIAALPYGTTVLVLQPGTNWSQVQWNGLTGYASSKYLKPKTTDPSTDPPTDPEPVTGVTYVVVETVNFRSGAATTYPSYGLLKPGVEVKRIGESGSWSKISYNGKTGYVHSAYIKLPSVSPPVTGTRQILILKKTAALRSGAGDSYSKLASLPSGTRVENLGNFKGVWANVLYDGRKGWINSGSLNAAAPYFRGGIPVVTKNYPLPSSYVPGTRDDTAWAQMRKLISDYKKKTGRTLVIASSYRSYSLQSNIFYNYVANYGFTKANTFSARPGYSEHQTGLAFDLNGSNSATWIQSSFQYTKEYTWLRANAHKYGFILRYPKGKTSITGYIFEPWHYRYVGTTIATAIWNRGITLEEYFNLP